MTDDLIKERVKEILDRHGEEYEITWERTSYPYYTSESGLIDIVRDAVKEVTGVDPEFSTTGGTSDGRFIARLGTEIVELGPVNATIHSVDEHVLVEDLARLSRMYEGILERLLTDGSGDA